MRPNLEIESVWAWYEAPLCGVARIGDKRLYYVWDDRVPDKDMMLGGKIPFLRRVFVAYELDASTWDSLESAFSLNGTDLFLAGSTVRRIHAELEQRPGFLAFSNTRVTFPRAPRLQPGRLP